MARVAEAHGAAADEHAERQVEMPGRRDQRRQAEAGARERHAEEHHRARATPVHHPAEDGAEDRRNQKAERERAGGQPARPAELVEDRREEERERGARVDADAHRDERDRDDGPAVEEPRRAGN